MIDIVELVIHKLKEDLIIITILFFYLSLFLIHLISLSLYSPEWFFKKLKNMQIIIAIKGPIRVLLIPSNRTLIKLYIRVS